MIQPPASLCDAVAKNDLAQVSNLLREGLDPNETDETNQTPLHLACELGHEMVAKMLLDHGATLEARNGVSNTTPLLIATVHGHTSIAIALLELGANPKVVGEGGTTALELAVRNNDISLMLALIKRGADVEAMSTFGVPMHVAAGFNVPIAISVLVRFGASVNTRDADGDTPLLTACSLGHIDCVQQLLTSGADPNIRSSSVSVKFAVCLTSVSYKYLAGR